MWVFFWFFSSCSCTVELLCFVWSYSLGTDIFTCHWAQLSNFVESECYVWELTLSHLVLYYLCFLMSFGQSCLLTEFLKNSCVRLCIYLLLVALLSSGAISKLSKKQRLGQSWNYRFSFIYVAFKNIPHFYMFIVLGALISALPAFPKNGLHFSRSLFLKALFFWDVTQRHWVIGTWRIYHAHCNTSRCDHHHCASSY